MSDQNNKVILRVPRGSLDALAEPMEFDMTEVSAVEARLCETEHANVNSANALGAVFNTMSLRVGKYAKSVQYELSKAKTLLKRREADMLIDEWPVFMAEHKLNDSKGMRDAFLTKDKIYADLTDRIDLLTAMESLLSEKKEAFIRGYQQMKQLYAAEKRDPTYAKPRG